MHRIPWEKIQRFFMQPKLWLFVGLVFILYSFVFERAGFIHQFRLKRENTQLRAQVELTQKKLEYLQEEIEALKHDIDRIKQEAIRNGYAEPDEVIIQLR